MTIGNAYEEKRNFIRMRVESPLTLTHNEKTLKGICIDISGTGMCIELREPLALGDEAVAYLPSLQDHFSPLHACVKINRLIQEGTLFYYGVEITELLN